ncbi:CysS/YqeB C-terminal domain-containing protein [Actinoplanes philippinensis]|uniref:CysS/YqeB C-terminal domain-containing protein n=1 Tax=Actinoplanes philippinensis TaxID=35752 RepID=UPI0033E4EF9A
MLTETGDPADLLVWYFGLAHGVSGRTDAGGENPALDAIAGDVADGRLGDALDVARGFASRLSPTLVISTAAVHLTREARAVALRKKAPREAAELRDSLEKLGYSVRDDGDRQLWRPLVRS